MLTFDSSNESSQNQWSMFWNDERIVADRLIYPSCFEFVAKVKIQKIYKKHDMNDQNFLISKKETYLMNTFKDVEKFSENVGKRIHALVKHLLPDQKNTSNHNKYKLRSLMFERALELRQKQNENKSKSIHDRCEARDGNLLINFKIKIIDNRDVMIECEKID